MRSTQENLQSPDYLITEDIPVNLEYGICLRPAVLFVKECMKYQNEIILQNKDRLASGKSLIELMQLEAYPGERLNLYVESSPDAKEISQRIYSGLTTKTSDPNFEE